MGNQGSALRCSLAGWAAGTVAFTVLTATILWLAPELITDLGPFDAVPVLIVLFTAVVFGSWVSWRTGRVRK